VSVETEKPGVPGDAVPMASATIAIKTTTQTSLFCMMYCDSNQATSQLNRTQKRKNSDSNEPFYDEPVFQVVTY
jgi:hypothetical protein